MGLSGNCMQGRPDQEAYTAEAAKCAINHLHATNRQILYSRQLSAPMSSSYKLNSLAHQERCPHLLLMHSSAISCMLHSFDSQHAEECKIMYAVILDTNTHSSATSGKLCFVTAIMYRSATSRML